MSMADLRPTCPKCHGSGRVSEESLQSGGLDTLFAAAEERGRRRGVEERDELRALLRECKAAVSEAIEDGSWGFGPLLGRINAALAPRDSAPCPDPPPGTLEAAEASARRGGQVGCGNIATYQAPRDSAPEPDPTCPEDFEPPWPKDRP